MRGELLAWAIRGAGLALGVLAVAAMLAIAAHATGVLVLVFVAVLLASALEPPVGALRTHLPLGRGATILVVYVGFFALVAGMTLVIVPGAVNQLDGVARDLPPLLERIREWASGLQPRALATSVTALVGTAQDALRPAPPEGTEVVRAGLTVAESVVSVVTLLAVVFFWLVEHARLQRYVLSFLPARRRSGAREAWNEIETRLGLWVRGQLILMAAIGFATGVAYSLLGVPSALLLALVAGIAEAIPIVGPLLGAVPAILLAATVSLELALVVAVVYVVIQVVEGNVLVPTVMRNTIGLSPFMVLVSLLVGAAVGGIVGAFLAVPVAASLAVVLERLQARRVPVAPDVGGTGGPGEADAAAMADASPEATARAAARGSRWVGRGP